MNINDLKDYIVGAKEVARRIDEDDINFCYKKTPMIFDWKSEGFKIEYILLNDIFSWLCYLGLGDDIIVDEEVNFINYCLDLNFSKEELQKLATSKLNNEYINQMPVSFILFSEAEIVYKDLIINQSVPVYSENLFRLFGVLGESFIACDGKITTDEKHIFDEYINLLWYKLKDFKERRGITPNYDDLVGEDISKQDITIFNNNLNKQTISKMNLVLKLLSQGYLLNDLNNIAYVSVNIISKWFHKGRMGDKNFEEFYSKCIKLDPILEIEFDNVIEHINLDDINDEICIDSDTDSIKHKSNSEPKNYIYKQHITKLKSQFQFKEKNTRKLIEKCFPAPQMTNTKFNYEVDNCSKIFSKKYENTMIILESASITSKLDDEIKSNVDVLKEINNKLNSLHEELLLNISKSGNQDVEILLEDMGRLIDSVKDY